MRESQIGADEVGRDYKADGRTQKRFPAQPPKNWGELIDEDATLPRPIQWAQRLPSDSQSVPQREIDRQVSEKAKSPAKQLEDRADSC